jgi:hypothetical protein
MNFYFFLNIFFINLKLFVNELPGHRIAEFDPGQLCRPEFAGRKKRGLRIFINFSYFKQYFNLFIEKIILLHIFAFSYYN